MRIYEIVQGQRRILQISSFDKVWDKLIVPNCKEILEMYATTNTLLYRGIAYNAGFMFRGSSRINRTPKDSHLFLSELFELGLKELGMTALRSNSLFAISKESFASHFGQYIYMIFPIDGFEYTWTSHADITLADRKEFVDYWANKKTIEMVNKAWLANDVNHKDILGHEWIYDYDILNPYRSVSTNVSTINELLIKHGYHPIKPIDLIDVDAINKNFKPRNTDLLEMLGSGNARETMIKGNYYAFGDYYENQIKEKLQYYRND